MNYRCEALKQNGERCQSKIKNAMNLIQNNDSQDFVCGRHQNSARIQITNDERNQILKAIRQGQYEHEHADLINNYKCSIVEKMNKNLSLNICNRKFRLDLFPHFDPIEIYERSPMYESENELQILRAKYTHCIMLFKQMEEDYEHNCHIAQDNDY